ncbi:unnamed protein product [Ostreobium quekettii]|uniref:Ubiquinone biosynthesis O-methyltransferase, mitochondrial n=1 Tax=Ostreobium quekettii TaxID=121088 RepID=A0A8S1JFF8_9CHLO|nr:unnamed protein product [Ostreobium quekettii]|eukprot:evm.model.scf_1053EXC.5 EVM.evm.TU.scf_1053EXC.5   scf_1053EXC:21501-23321(-)
MSRWSARALSRLAVGLQWESRGVWTPVGSAILGGPCSPAAPFTSLRSFSADPQTGSRPSGGFVNQREVEKFQKMAGQWWDPSGPLGPLHDLNPTRCKFIREALCWHYARDPYHPQPLSGISILDVGCGGGLLSEPLARMGATVTGIDVVADAVEAAKIHAAGDAAISSRLKFRAVSVDDLQTEGAKFDVVIASEVIEHVKHPKDFISTLSGLLPEQGMLIMSTLNRTLRSYCLAIVGAEYMLGMVPRGTHDWAKFITPQELIMATEDTPLQVAQLSGMVLDPLRGRWSLQQDTSVNYIAAFVHGSIAEHMKVQAV